MAVVVVGKGWLEERGNRDLTRRVEVREVQKRDSDRKGS